MSRQVDYIARAIESQHRLGWNVSRGGEQSMAFGIRVTHVVLTAISHAAREMPQCERRWPGPVRRAQLEYILPAVEADQNQYLGGQEGLHHGNIFRDRTDVRYHLLRRLNGVRGTSFHA